MTKTLKDFMEVYRPKSPDEQKFVDKHVTVKHKDRNGNGDDVFNATNVKTDKRKETRHGYDSGEDEKVYEELVAAYAEKYDMTIEEVESIIEELIAEEVEDLDEISKKTVSSYLDKTSPSEGGFNGLSRDKWKSRVNARTTAGTKLRDRARVSATESVEDLDESYQELMALKNNIARNEKKMKSIPGIHPEKKRLAIQIEKDNKRHKELFNKYWGKNEEVEHIDEDWMHPDHAKELKDPSTSAARKKEIKNAYARAAARRAQQSDDHEEWKEKRAAAKQGRSYHEEVEIDEKTLTPAEMKKREEVVKAIKRGNPKMDKSMAYAIATKTAKRVAEEVEELDELSKKTLGSYINKAATKIGDQGITAGLKIQNNEKADKNFKTMGKRQKGIAMATNKLTKEEAEELGEDTFTDASMANLHVMKHKQRMKDIEKSTKLHPLMKVRMMSDAKKKLANLEKTRDHYVAKHEKAESRKKKVTEEVEELDELSKKTLGSYVSKAARSATGLIAGSVAAGMSGSTTSHGREMGRTAVKRLKGVDTAAKKLAREEVEDLDELSNDTLKSYAHKASNDRTKQFGNDRKYSNRLKGTSQAVGKLTKEDIINRTIDKYVPESSKYSPEERMLMRLEDVSEKHIDTLMGIFENLNSDNQNKMLIVAETHEGINSLIDFAITNRGE